MKLSHVVIKVSSIPISRQWYSSLLFEDTYQNGDGWCSWQSGVTIIAEDSWDKFFSISGYVENTPSASIVLEVPSFDTFLRILSLRDDRETIVAGEGSFQGRRYIKLIDPDMNIVVVIDSAFDYAVVSNEKSEGRDERRSISTYKFSDKVK